jgi:hypothetical protein
MATPAGILIRVYADFSTMPIGTGGVGIVPGGGYANEPGMGASLGPAPGENAQTLRLQQKEATVQASGTITEAELATALTSAATDLASQLTAAIVAQINGWSTGGG